jgi:hypothetical protein
LHQTIMEPGETTQFHLASSELWIQLPRFALTIQSIQQILSQMSKSSPNRLKSQKSLALLLLLETQTNPS